MKIKNIVLGVTGGIAAYKAAELTSRLKKEGYDVITSIIIEQRRVFCCCKVTIEPVITSDGCEAVVINTFNPSFLLNNNLKVGSTIQFARQSGTVNVFCNGTMLDINRKSLED